MQMHGITGIDHPVIAVRDMAASRATFERLGFTVTPRGSHAEWGTGNWCVMFNRDYLELRGILDPHKYTHGLEAFLRQGEGLMGLAFSCQDANLSHSSLIKNGFRPPPVVQLSRNFELPDGPAKPRFNLCFLEAHDTPGLMSVVLCQHLTPELLRRPDWLNHPNGACGVQSMTTLVEDLPAATSLYKRLFGSDAVSEQKHITTVRFRECQALHVADEDGLHLLHPALWRELTPPPPRLIVLTIQSKDLRLTANYLESRGIASQSAAGRLCPAPDTACGVHLEFCPSANS